MIGRSERQSQTSLIRDATDDKDLSVNSAHRENEGSDNPFFYANSCLGCFPVGPLDFHAFAKGQLMAMAIFIPAAIALFIFFAL